MIHDELLHKWINNSISKEELTEFEKRPEYEELVQLYKNTEQLSSPEFNKEAILKEILATPKGVKVAEISPKVARFPKWVPIVLAASVIAVLGFLFFPQNDKQDTIELATKINESQQLVLPDGSTCLVAENSNLTYQEQNWLDDRIVNLNGKATFKVNKGNDFTVQTPYGKVKVLGTEFIVDAINNYLKVSCSKGKVQVSDLNDSFQTVITANESATVVNNQQIITQKQNLTKLDHATLQEVLDALKKQFKVSFETGSVNLAERMTCNFQHQNLEKALETTLAVLDIQYKIEGNTIIFEQI